MSPRELAALLSNKRIADPETESRGDNSLADLRSVGSATLLARLGDGAGRSGEPVHICLCGAGRAGKFHLNSIRVLGDKVARLAAVVDPAPHVKDIAENYGAFWASDLDTVLSSVEKIDAVIVASTTDTHFALCKTALMAGKAVFTEKPISLKREESAEVIELSKKCGLPFIVGYQRRCDKNFKQLKELIDGGALGRDGVRMIRCTSRDNPLPPLAYLRTSGGIFHDMLTHDFDMINFLTGETLPETVHAIAHCYVPEIKEMDDVDTVIITLKYASGLLATVDTSRVAAYGYDQRVELFGEKGMLTAHNEAENTVEYASADGHLKPCSQWSFPQRYKHTYTIEMAEFCLMVQEGLCESEETTRRHLDMEKIATAGEISHRLGRSVRIDEVEALEKELGLHKE